MKKNTTLIVSVIILTALTGCVIQKRNTSEKKTYLLNIERPKSMVSIKSPVSLGIDFCQIASPFSGRSLVYRTGPVEYTQDYYNLFLSSPSELITEAMLQWFDHAGYANTRVVGEMEDTDFFISSKVNVFCADFEDRNNPAAKVQMRVTIMYSDVNSGKVAVHDDLLTAKTPLPVKPTAAEVVEGLSTSLSQILKELETLLEAELKSGS